MKQIINNIGAKIWCELKNIDIIKQKLRYKDLKPSKSYSLIWSHEKLISNSFFKIQDFKRRATHINMIIWKISFQAGDQGGVHWSGTKIRQVWRGKPAIPEENSTVIWHRWWNLRPKISDHVHRKLCNHERRSRWGLNSDIWSPWRAVWENQGASKGYRSPSSELQHLQPYPITLCNDHKPL